ncbi:hypothetical protein PoB_005589100 [Plakobranchus ocellatus]|uniref:Uncharacterized protein n=1 Tax=Plakobranchus ocellatus TaxID=259542 RepID=A0AAV4CDG2_9GAST|nr:hypothetical protein PoB_005589100 [Plakobranchus ocellatus]
MIRVDPPAPCTSRAYPLALSTNRAANCYTDMFRLIDRCTSRADPPAPSTSRADPPGPSTSRLTHQLRLQSELAHQLRLQAD